MYPRKLSVSVYIRGPEVTDLCFRLLYIQCRTQNPRKLCISKELKLEMQLSMQYIHGSTWGYHTLSRYRHFSLGQSWPHDKVFPLKAVGNLSVNAFSLLKLYLQGYSLVETPF